MDKLKVIITGSTGMVGEGVLHECLHHPGVESILVINRKTCGVTHPKLTEILHTDFFDISPLKEQVAGYNACFFCLGVSSVGMKKPEYTLLTHTLTMSFATTLAGLNPDMTFCYVSGAGTDSSEQGRMMWARVKGKTENDLMKLPFKQVYNFRPAFIIPTRSLKNTHVYYKYFVWLIPVIRLLLPNYITTLKNLGLAMINSALSGYSSNALEVKDIKQLAKRIY
ncbi:MAG: epimerase [Porphyromonadaceae bacterium]|nr:MAG: epimerase [Porphyromonadaceae bacterium]